MVENNTSFSVPCLDTLRLLITSKNVTVGKNELTSYRVHINSDEGLIAVRDGVLLGACFKLSILNTVLPSEALANLTVLLALTSGLLIGKTMAKIWIRDRVERIDRYINDHKSEIQEQLGDGFQLINS